MTKHYCPVCRDRFEDDDPLPHMRVCLGCGTTLSVHYAVIACAVCGAEQAPGVACEEQLRRVLNSLGR